MAKSGVSAILNLEITGHRKRKTGDDVEYLEVTCEGDGYQNVKAKYVFAAELKDIDEYPIGDPVTLTIELRQQRLPLKAGKSRGTGATRH